MHTSNPNPPFPPLFTHYLLLSSHKTIFPPCDEPGVRESSQIITYAKAKWEKGYYIMCPLPTSRSSIPKSSPPHLPSSFTFLCFSLLLLAGFEPFHFHFQKKILFFRICRNVLLNECSCNAFRCGSASLFGSGPCRNAESHSFSFKVSSSQWTEYRFLDDVALGRRWFQLSLQGVPE